MTHTTSTPVASGSNVPQCPTFFVCNFFLLFLQYHGLYSLQVYLLIIFHPFIITSYILTKSFLFEKKGFSITYLNIEIIQLIIKIIILIKTTVAPTGVENNIDNIIPTNAPITDKIAE